MNSAQNRTELRAVLTIFEFISFHLMYPLFCQDSSNSGEFGCLSGKKLPEHHFYAKIREKKRVPKNEKPSRIGELSYHDVIFLDVPNCQDCAEVLT